MTPPQSKIDKLDRKALHIAVDILLRLKVSPLMKNALETLKSAVDHANSEHTISCTDFDTFDEIVQRLEDVIGSGGLGDAHLEQLETDQVRTQGIVLKLLNVSVIKITFTSETGRKMRLLAKAYTRGKTGSTA